MKSFICKIALYSIVVCSVFVNKEGKAASMRSIAAGEEISQEDLDRLNVTPWQAGPLNAGARYFDLACSGDCDLNDVSRHLSITGGDMPRVVEISADTGNVIFSHPQPMGIIETPKGHTASVSVVLEDISPKDFSDGRKFLALGIRERGGEYKHILYMPYKEGTDTSGSASRNNTSADFTADWKSVWELVPLISKTNMLDDGYNAAEPGTPVTEHSVAGAADKFDFGTVFRVKITVN